MNWALTCQSIYIVFQRVLAAYIKNFICRLENLNFCLSNVNEYSITGLITNTFPMQGGSWKNWKRRWFVLNDRCLYYFQHTAETSPKGIIPLEGVKVRPLPNRNGKDWVFEIFSDSGSETVKGCKTDSNGAVVQGNHKQYR